MIASSLTRPVELSDQPGAARRQLAAVLADAGWDGDTDAVLLAVHEAMVNAQRHAGGVSRATATVDGPTVVVEVVDGGRGFGVPDAPPLPDAAAERGRGLYLIRQLTTDAHVERSGNEVCFVLRFER
ncbi:MAG: ATP-binding protein [Actinomycetota bacterium]|nr:ATP-binding protein [Actinomycetota bacterium]